MAFVLDASVVLAWHFTDEAWQEAKAFAARARHEEVLAPAYLGVEVANGLLRGERMERTSSAAVDLFLRAFGQLRIDYRSFSHGEVVSSLLPLARAHGLKLFDAGYLYIALTNRLPLVSFDDRLVSAARVLDLPQMEDRP